MADIEVERLTEDRLERQVWRFSVRTSFGSGNSVALRNEYYGIETRASIRHKWVSNPRTRYSSFDTRAYNSGIVAANVPLPSDVVMQAKALLRVYVVNAAGKSEEA